MINENRKNRGANKNRTCSLPKLCSPSTIVPIILLCTCSNVYAGYANLLWHPGSGIIQNGNISYTDYTATGSTIFNSGPNGLSPGNVIWYDCSGSGPNVFGRMVKTAWIVLPSEVVANGIKLTMNVSGGAWEAATGYSFPVQWKAFKATTIPSTDRLLCPTNSFASVDWYAPQATISMTMTAVQSLAPGRYTISVPYKYTFEEYKWSDSSPGPQPNNKIVNAILATNSNSFNVTVDVTSRCSYSAAPFELAHGSMTPAESSENTTRKHMFAINCTPGTSLSVRLVGNEPVGGKTANYTRCGQGGVCGLAFDGDKYDETLQIDGPTTLAITSTYHPNAGPVVEGAFTGSGILQLFIN